MVGTSTEFVPESWPLNLGTQRFGQDVLSVQASQNAFAAILANGQVPRRNLRSNTESNDGQRIGCPCGVFGDFQ